MSDLDEIRIQVIVNHRAIAAKLADLHALCFAASAQAPWPASAIATLLAMPGTTGLVALTQAPEPAGFVIGRVVAGEGEVLTLCVAPAVRRRGMATALLGELGTACPTVQRWLLEVAVTNTAARAVYNRLGYREVGRRVNYYRRDGQATDALIFERISDE